LKLNYVVVEVHIYQYLWMPLSCWLYWQKLCSKQ